MKKLIFLFLVISQISFAQTYPTYYTFGGEMIFAGASSEFSSDWGEVKNNMRFTAFFHLKQYTHFHFSDKAGFYTGINIRNIGMSNTFSNMDPTLQHELIGKTNVNELKIIQRAYTLGIPLAFKYGNMADNPTYVFGGGEIEMAFQYKEKYFDGNEKLSGQKKTGWFSDRTNIWLPSLFVGVQLPGGVTFTFKRYMSDFLNTSFSSNGVKIYENSSTQLYYLSMGLTLHHLKQKTSTNDKIEIKEM